MYNTVLGYRTDRLILRKPDTKLATSILYYFIRNKEFLKKWEPLKNERFYSIDYQKNQQYIEAKLLSEGKLYKLWISNKAEPNKIIGSVALNNIIRGCFQSCQLGYRLDKDEFNKGLITEAVKAIIHIAFDQLTLHRIEANIMPINKQSLRVTEKLGFKYEGLAHKYLKINGKWEDHIHMVLLNEDEY